MSKSAENSISVDVLKTSFLYHLVRMVVIVMVRYEFKNYLVIGLTEILVLVLAVIAACI